MIILFLFSLPIILVAVWHGTYYVVAWWQKTDPSRIPDSYLPLSSHSYRSNYEHQEYPTSMNPYIPPKKNQEEISVESPKKLLVVNRDEDEENEDTEPQFRMDQLFPMPMSGPNNTPIMPISQPVIKPIPVIEVYRPEMPATVEESPEDSGREEY